RNRSTLSPFHPVLSVLHPQGFRKRFGPRPQKSSRSQRRLNAFTPGYLKCGVTKPNGRSRK
ncbi:unnamed protein product, partial [Ascophyllum nodosum]